MPGRGRRAVEYGLRRLRNNPLLQVCLVVSFLSYGGMTGLLLTGRIGSRPTAYGNEFVLACVVTFLSLASWFFLILWFPALELTRRFTPHRTWVGTLLETFAVGCVAVVTLLTAVIVVVLARS